MVVVIWWDWSWAVVHVVVVEIGRRNSGAVVHVVVVVLWEWSWAVVHVVVIEIGRSCGGSVVHVVVVEMVAWGVAVVDVRSVDASCYVVPILQVVVTALVVVQ